MGHRHQAHCHGREMAAVGDIMGALNALTTIGAAIRACARNPTMKSDVRIFVVSSA
jgi:hypothetical protein